MNEIEKFRGNLTQSEIISPLSEQEQKRLIELENLVKESQKEIKKAQFVIGKAFSEILDSKLYRATHKTFAEYVSEKFGYTREHAYQLASISPYGQLNSVTAAIIFDREVRRLAKEFGFDKNEIQNQMRSIIELTLKLLCDVADDTHNSVTKPLTQNFFDALKDFVKLGTIEIDSQQMTIKEAQEKGLFKQILPTRFLKAVEENILTNEDIIKIATINRSELKLEKNPTNFNKEDIKLSTKLWRIAELKAIEYLDSLDGILEVEDVSESNLGYDLKVIFKNNRKIYVEVKKVEHFNESFKLTTNEFSDASHYGDDYYVALVIIEPFQIKFISNPAKELKFTKVVERWAWKSGDYKNNLQENL